MKNSDSVRSTKVDVERPRERLISKDALFCAAVVAALVLVAYPVVDAGVNDDWSYIRTTQDFVKTGQFAYNGWAAPTLGWMVPWGAAAARFFGASFTAIRLSMLPVAMGCVVLYHAILRGFGLNRAHAFLGTIVLSTSPLFVAMSSVFMTDVPGLMSLLLCLYFCQCAVNAEGEGEAIGWLVAAALSSVVTGSARQTSWLGAFVMVPCCGWLLTQVRNRVRVIAAVWCVSALAIAAEMRWLATRPFLIPESLVKGRVTFEVTQHLIVGVTQGALLTMLLCFPVLAMGSQGLRQLSLRGRLGMVGGFVVAAAMGAVAMHHETTERMVSPWLGNVITASGIFMTEGIPGPAGPSMPKTVGLGITLVLLLFAVGFVMAVQRGRHERDAKGGWREMAVLLGPLSAVYCLLLLPRAGFAVLFDRYLLLVVAVALVVLLRLHQDFVDARIPVGPFLVVVALGLIGVAATHDLFSMYRARERLVEEIEGAGVRPTAIRGGFEYDAITQVTAWGALNDVRVKVPGHRYVERAPSDRCTYWFSRFTPAVQPQYVITRGRNSCFVPAAFAPVSYRVWMPWTTRELDVGEIAGSK